MYALKVIPSPGEFAHKLPQKSSIPTWRYRLGPELLVAPTSAPTIWENTWRLT